MADRIITINVKGLNMEYDREQQMVVIRVPAISIPVFTPEFTERLESNYGKMGAVKKLNELHEHVEHQEALEFIAVRTS